VPATESFLDLIQRVRHRDPVAATIFVRQYEPLLRRKIRVWLRVSQPHLQRLLDSTDVCQSVLTGFFVRAALGQFELDDPARLWQLLVTMCQRRLQHHARDQEADCRDARRVSTADPDTVAAKGFEPSRLVAGQELLQEVRDHLDSEEKQVADLRGQGSSWADIAHQLGGTADGRRMQLGRALDRVARRLGLEDLSEE
jgi:RNA polymerase sigma-70 factor (ECF subfamily)